MVRNKRKKEEYGIFPPYIDAYRKSYGKPIDFNEFTENLKNHAHEWGEQSIGSAVLRGAGIPQTDDGRNVVCIGWFGEKNFAAVVNLADLEDNYWFQKIEVIEFNWPSEWDVT